MSRRFLTEGIAALVSIVIGAVIPYRWEFLRSLFYDRFFRVVEEHLAMTWDDAFRYGFSAFFIGLGLWLFWRNSPKRAEKRLLQSATGKGTIDAKADAYLKKVREMRDYDFKQIDTRFSMLCNALRARDLITLLEKTNATILPLGQRLLAARAEDYPNRTKWLGEYGVWHQAIEKVDEELNPWEDLRKSYAPFLHLTGRDFEKCLSLPPDSIKPSESIDTVTPYKTLCLVQARWEAEFPQIIGLLKARANRLPG
ncbi:MAG TPA: hypothetical protein VGX95_09635 [Xanthobacteraceae bacterium]|jgi:hypothetical protein|nr:hypothetical protein [Xanthobacteraceae bacterium]